MLPRGEYPAVPSSMARRSLMVVIKLTPVEGGYDWLLTFPGGVSIEGFAEGSRANAWDALTAAARERVQ